MEPGRIDHMSMRQVGGVAEGQQRPISQAAPLPSADQAPKVTALGHLHGGLVSITIRLSDLIQRLDSMAVRLTGAVAPTSMSPCPPDDFKEDGLLPGLDVIRTDLTRQAARLAEQVEYLENLA